MRITAILAQPDQRAFTAYPFLSGDGQIYGFGGHQLQPVDDAQLDELVASGRATRLRRLARWKQDGSQGLALAYNGEPSVDDAAIGDTSQRLVALWLGKSFEQAAYGLKDEGVDLGQVTDLRHRVGATFVTATAAREGQPDDGIILILPIVEAKALLDEFIDKAFAVVRYAGPDDQKVANRLTAMMTFCRPDHVKSLAACWFMTDEGHRGQLLGQQIQANMNLVASRWVDMLEEVWADGQPDIVGLGAASGLSNRAAILNLLTKEQ